VGFLSRIVLPRYGVRRAAPSECRQACSHAEERKRPDARFSLVSMRLIPNPGA